MFHYSFLGLAHTKLTVDSRCEQLKHQVDAMGFSLQCAFRRQIAQLPRKIRRMTMSEFATTYAGSVSGVMAEGAGSMQKELDTWVAATPRLTARKTSRKTAHKTGVPGTLRRSVRQR